jgi:pimeloyl-ACP methyl ester carboxylesterase
VGLYGHSQGASVVIEAAGRRPPIAFAVPSSGPGVPLAEQERFAVLRHFERTGASSEQIESALREFDQVVAMMRERMPFDAARRRIDEVGLGALYDEFERPLIPEDAPLWDHFCALIDYDPRPALERIEVPLLALFGGKDDVTPVAESVATYRERLRPDLLTVTVYPLGDHRVQVGDPPRPAAGYLETISAFVTSAVT